MTLAAPIRHPTRPEHVLLQAGFVLDGHTLRKLERFGLAAVWIHHPGFDFLDRRMNQEVPQSRIRLYQEVKQSFTAIANRTSGAFDLLEYRAVVGNAIMAMLANKNNAVFAERVLHGESELFGHSANVAYLSLLIGMRLKDYIYSQRRHVTRTDAEDLTNLGIGALLHDLGKLRLDPHLQGVHHYEPEADCQEYRSHSEHGYRAIQGRVEATAAAIVFHHHQRYDGRGFPVLRPPPGKKKNAPMEGNRIHVYSRIVAVANAIDGLITSARRAGQPLVAALYALQQPDLAPAFDPVVLDAALRCVPPFPLGAQVELSNGCRAVVTDLNDDAPCQPRVQLLDERSGADSDAFHELDLARPDTPVIASDGGVPVDQYLYEFCADCPETEDDALPSQEPDAEVCFAVS